MVDDGTAAKVHGFFMYVPFGIIMPGALIVARFMQYYRRRLGDGHLLPRRLFYAHATLQVLALLVLIAGGAYSFKYFKVGTKHTHQRLGYTLWGLVIAQFLMSINRPPLGSGRRLQWYTLHWLIGTSTVILGFYDIYVGMTLWERATNKSIKKFNIAFSVQVSLITLVYLLQDRIGNFSIQLYGLQQERENSLHMPRLKIPRFGSAQKV
ncbi:hypothetical protein KP509_19G020600 [Ceratopteris richardii]|uniref:Cytochrome b561 domain-containing protein n=1 Tax=Ceratopteris richardii TaxID=49495 RepID=A0A8T2SIC9_CERRI|nr:hypothetical protein KP509_19G020600 [Ceratopteris richardii]